jgi:hypothetical protein
MDRPHNDAPSEQLTDTIQNITAHGVLRPVAVLNPAAGAHAIPDDVREIQAALRAGERSWRRFPYYAWRYGEKGAAFTRSDSAWLVTLAHHPQAVVDKQVRWLGTLLSSRGMPQWLLQVHLEGLYEELTAIRPDKQLLYQRLQAAAGMLLELRRQHISDERFESLAAEFDARVGGEWTGRLPETGRLLLAAVADERSGIEQAVITVEAWMTAPERFPTEWIAAVRAIIHAARSHLPD